MELTLVRATNRRFPLWIPLLLAFAFVLVAAVPLAAGDGDRPVAASMFVSRTQASPGDNVTFWIWVNPLKEQARNLIVTESNLTGFAIVSTEAPGSCLQTQLTWVCVLDEVRPFAIGVHVVVGSGTDGKDLVNEAQVQVWAKGEHKSDEEHRAADPISVSAAVHVVTAPVTEEPQIDVQLNSTRADVVPDSLQNYRVDVRNRGNSTANHVSVVVSVPESITVVSASRWPTVEDGRLTWILDSVPVGSMKLLFNATVRSSNQADHVELGVAATYQAADGGVVRVETKPSSFSLLPLPTGPRVWPLQVGMVLAVLAFVGRSLFLPQGPIGSARKRAPGAEEVFLLHRSGILLKHFSSDPTRGIDSDILGGMLAAVRMFVEDSMHPSAGPLQEIRFRGGSIVFVTGKNAAVAALNARGNHTLFTHRTRGILRDFERRNGDALTNFDGVAGRLDGVDALLGRIAS